MKQLRPIGPVIVYCAGCRHMLFGPGTELIEDQAGTWAFHREPCARHGIKRPDAHPLTDEEQQELGIGMGRRERTT